MEDIPEDMDDSFDGTYETNEDFFGHPYLELKDYFKGLEERGSILDVGSGQGRDSLFLASIGFDVTAIDISRVGIDQMLSKAREKDLEIECIVGDALEVVIKDLYDIILFDMLLHSFEDNDQYTLFEKYSKNLKNDGKFCIVYPDDMKKEHFLDQLNKLSENWKVLFEKTIYDVPKIDGMEDEGEFTFKLLFVEKE